jgi:hypothetical protein
MKIENDHPTPHIKTHTASSKPADGKTFRSVFDQSLQASVAPTRISNSLSVTRAPAAGAVSIGPLSPEQAAVQSFENLLGALNTYQERLGDGRFSLRMLERDLSHIDYQCRQLSGLANNLPPDGRLFPVLKEGLTIARMEMERFQRGDYC